MVKIGEAAKLLGCGIDTLRQWERSGEPLPDRKTKGGTRFYDPDNLLNLGDADAPTIGYARVSSHDQKADLERQREMLETYCAAKGWRTEIIADLGSGMNFNKRGLRRLLEIILRRKTRRLVLTHKDRLLRFGAELVFSLCELQGIEIVIIHRGERPSLETELAEGILEIITVFSARLYGSRSKKNRNLLQTLQAEADRIGEEFGLYEKEDGDAARPQS